MRRDNKVFIDQTIFKLYCFGSNQNIWRIKVDMEKRWNALWKNAAPSIVESCYNALRFNYQDRPYHNFVHVADCLRQLDQVKVTFNPLALEVALWYHDVVYDPKRKNNEMRSVDFAQKQMCDLGAPQDFRVWVGSLILATKHSEYIDHPEELTIVDIDLSTLGESAQEYDKYAKAIRQEYAWVPEADYVKGRIAMLNSFLERRRIYYTDHFYQLYEQNARRNMVEEIARLKG